MVERRPVDSSIPLLMGCCCCDLLASSSHTNRTPMSSYASASEDPPAMQTEEGVYIRHGSLQLHNSLRIAYTMWTNSPTLNTPVESIPAAAIAAAAAAAAQQPKATKTPTPAVTLATVAADSAPSRLNMLAIHDTGDNAASFAVLAPALMRAVSERALASPPALTCLLSIDLVGHGLSSWRPRDGTYSTSAHPVSDVSMLLATVLRWRECVLIGHAMGARVALMIAASSAVQLPLSNPILPHLPALLGCVVLDPFPYEQYRCQTDADYAAAMTHQSEPDALRRSVSERATLQRTRKTLYSSFDAAVIAYHDAHPDMEESSVRTLLQRGLKLVRRPRVAPHPDALAPLAAFQADEIEMPVPATTTAALATTAATLPERERVLVAGRDFDPSSEEVGWVHRNDPLLDAPTTLAFARSQYAGAIAALVSPTLLVQPRTQRSSLDRPFQAHMDAMLRGSLFELGVGGGAGVVRDVVGDSLAHLDSESAGEVAPIVADFVRDVWNNRRNIRADIVASHEWIRAQQQVARERMKVVEADFYARAAASAASKSHPIINSKL